MTKSPMNDLKWLVQVHYTTGSVGGQWWDTIAGFSVASIACRHADECARSNPGTNYRVMAKSGRRGPRWVSFYETDRDRLLPNGRSFIRGETSNA